MEPKQYHFKLPRDRKPANIRIPEVWYPGVKDMWEKSTSKRIFNPIFGIKAIVIHATAGHSSDGAMSVMRDGKASWHWLIPDENEAEHENLVWACAPETLTAWHVRNSISHPEINEGKNKTNHWSLGIEIVNRQINDPFSDWQVKITADIVKYCWAKYPNLEHIVSHAKLDPTRRTDPGTLFPWDDFKNQVLNTNFDDMLVFESLVEDKSNHLTEMDIETVHHSDLCC